MQPQINTREQSRVNQNPIAYMTKNYIPFGIHNAFFLDVLASKTGKGWLSVTATHLWTNKLPYMFSPNTLVSQVTQL